METADSMYDRFLDDIERMRQILTRGFDCEDEDCVEDDGCERYNRNGVVGFEVLRAYLTPDEWRGFCRGNLFKYIMRYDHKGGIEDLMKAADYLGMLADAVEEECKSHHVESVDDCDCRKEPVEVSPFFAKSRGDLMVCAAKVVEEAEEVRYAAKCFNENDLRADKRRELLEECVDVVQCIVNIYAEIRAANDEIVEATKRVNAKNKERGRI